MGNRTQHNYESGVAGAMIAGKLWKWEDRCILYYSDSTKTHRGTGGSQEAVNDGCCVFCPNPSQIQIVLQGVMPTVTDALLFVS